MIVSPLDDYEKFKVGWTYEDEQRLCAHCGKAPIHARNDHGALVEVDACFQGAIEGSESVSGCCGHGDLSKAYVRLSVRDTDGQTRQIDLCGFKVQALGHFRTDTRMNWVDWKAPTNDQGSVYDECD